MSGIATDYGELAFVLFTRDGDRHVPFDVRTVDAGIERSFDFEWCRRDSCLYFDESGSGPVEYVDSLLDGVFVEPDPPHRFWCNEGIVGAPSASETELLRRGYARILTAPEDPFADATEGDCVWCSVCEDWLPEEYDTTPCEHLTWCSGCGEYVGSGSDDLPRRDRHRWILWGSNSVPRVVHACHREAIQERLGYHVRVARLP